MTDLQTKACPFCGEEILEVAIKCKFCKSDLNQSVEQDNMVNPTEVGETESETGCLYNGCVWTLAVLAFLAINALVNYLLFYEDGPQLLGPVELPF